MKRVHLIVVAAIGLAAALIGCAGSSDNGNNTTGVTLPGTPRIEAVVDVERTNLKDPSKYTDAELRDPTKVNPNDLIDPTLLGVQDPRDIQTGEQYWFQLVTYDNAGDRIIIDNGVTWSTSDESGEYGDIGQNSGLFVAGSNVNQTDQFVFAYYNGTRYEVAYNVRPRQARLLGKITEEGTDKPIPGVELFFYDSFNTLVGQVSSSYDGSFRASVPTNTTMFTPTVASVPIQYYQSFLYEGLRYTLGQPQCKASLPSLTTGTTSLPSAVQLKLVVAGQPTPPPTGCTL